MGSRAVGSQGGCARPGRLPGSHGGYLPGSHERLVIMPSAQLRGFGRRIGAGSAPGELTTAGDEPGWANLCGRSCWARSR